MLNLISDKTLAQKTMQLKDVIANIMDNHFVLPPMQRGYEWKPKDVAYLADSLIKGLPIQQIITMPLKGSKMDNNSYRSLAGLDEKKALQNAVLVFDGQQRLTSIGKIFIKSMNSNNYSFDIFNIIKHIYKIEDVIDFVSQVGKKSLKEENTHSRYMNCSTIYSLISEKSKDEIVSLFEQKVKSFLENNQDNLSHLDDEELVKIKFKAPSDIYQLFLNMLQTEIALCEINPFVDEEFLEEAFKRINKSGVKLSTSTLINSTSATRNGQRTDGIFAYIFEDLATAKCHNFVKKYLGYKETDNFVEYQQIGHLFRILHLIQHFEGKEVDRTLLSVRNNLLCQQSEYWYDGWDKYKDEILKIFTWFDKEELDIAVADIVLIYLTFFLINLKIDVDSKKTNPKLLQWLSKQAVTLTIKGVSLGAEMVNYLLFIHKNMKAFLENENGTIEAAYSLPSLEHKVSKEDVLNAKINSTLGNAWKFLNCTNKIWGLTHDITGVSLQDYWNNKTGFDLHHVIPKSQFKNRDVQTKSKINSIANLRILNSKFNQEIISDLPFKDYMSKLEQNHSNFEATLKMNFIPSNWKEVDEMTTLELMAEEVAKVFNSYLNA